MVKKLSLIFLPLLFNNVSAQEATVGEQVDVNQLIKSYHADVLKACPGFWEEITTKIDITNQSSNLWIDDELGRADFIEFLRDSMGTSAPDDAGLNVMADDPLTVATECATQKIQLMQTLVVDMPRNIMGSMQLVAQTFGAMLGDGYTGDSSDIFDLGDATGVPPGTLLSYSGKGLPKGRFLWADGQLISRTEFKKLFEAIGTTYGSGDGLTTFKLPDTKNLVIRGANVGDDVGKVEGSNSLVLIRANLPKVNLNSTYAGHHTHNMVLAGNHRHKHHDRRANGYRAVRGGGAVHDSESYTGYAGTHKHPIYGAGNHKHTVPLGGNNQAIDLTPRHLKTKFIIAY